MAVTLSRNLAAAGYAALRFDFSGIGDSLPPNRGGSIIQSNLADLADALDWLEANLQARRFVLIGLCTGADHAILFGHTDARVAGAVLIDPAVPATKQYYLHYVGARLIRWRSWIGLLTGRSGLVATLVAHVQNRLRTAPSAAEIAWQDLPFSPHLKHSYQCALDRGMQLLCVFTADHAMSGSGRAILDAFDDARAQTHMDAVFFPESDHLFSSLRHRETLLGRILGWVALKFPPDPPEGKVLLF
jgi:dienelactone hydrolase